MKPILTVTFIASVASIASVAFAHEPIVQKVPTPLEGVLEIPLHPGVGSNINFEGVGEEIQFISLENKSFVGLSTDGCPSGNNCQTLGSLVHISPIDKLDLPGVINVNNKAKQSLLTVVTKDGKGRKKTYVFNLRRAKSSDKAIALIELTPPPPTPAPVTPDVSVYPQLFDRMSEDRKNRQELVARLFKGLQIANRQGELNGYSTVQFQAIKSMILAVRDGRELPEAAAKYAVDLNLVSRLILLSHEQTN
jgi:hypothetical protein